MPKNKSAAIRYRVIDQMLNNKRAPYPSLEEMASRCSSILDADISTSTIEKDIRAMREQPPKGYGAPIVYSKIESGYTYGEVGFSIAELNLNEEEWTALQFAAQLLYQYKDVPVFSNFKNAIERINTRFSLGIDGEDKMLEEIVQFEKSVDTKGMDLVELIYTAIRNKQEIQFKYRNIYKEKSTSTSLLPYLIKEHRNRWYVIGWSEEKEKYTTYALDRMSDVEASNKNFKRRSDFQVNTFFQHSTGIMQSNAKPEEVVLTIKKPISDLVLLEPLHGSQQVMLEKSDSIQIRLKVLVNKEFLFNLLRMGSYCIVNKPASLRKRIKSELDQMSTNYR
jgi:predicted DNA-binding transcriptional regulator YafY